MAMELNGTKYEYVLGSDVVRDGMYLEINDEPNGIDPLLEIFYSDVTHKMTVTLFKPNVSMEIIEWAITVARKRLPAQTTTDD